MASPPAASSSFSVAIRIPASTWTSTVGLFGSSCCMRRSGRSALVPAPTTYSSRRSNCLSEIIAPSLAESSSNAQPEPMAWMAWPAWPAAITALTSDVSPSVAVSLLWAGSQKSAGAHVTSSAQVLRVQSVLWTPTNVGAEQVMSGPLGCEDAARPGREPLDLEHGDEREEREAAPHEVERRATEDARRHGRAGRREQVQEQVLVAARRPQRRDRGEHERAEEEQARAGRDEEGRRDDAERRARPVDPAD